MIVLEDRDVSLEHMGANIEDTLLFLHKILSKAIYFDDWFQIFN